MQWIQKAVFYLGESRIGTVPACNRFFIAWRRRTRRFDWLPLTCKRKTSSISMRTGSARRPQKYQYKSAMERWKWSDIRQKFKLFGLCLFIHQGFSPQCQTTRKIASAAELVVKIPLAQRGFMRWIIQKICHEMVSNCKKIVPFPQLAYLIADKIARYFLWFSISRRLIRFSRRIQENTK